MGDFQASSVVKAQDEESGDQSCIEKLFQHIGCIDKSDLAGVLHTFL